MARVVAAGSRLLLQTPTGGFVLRVLDDTPLGDRWAIPVLADLGAVAAGAADVDVPTDGGVVRVRAAVEQQGGMLRLRPVGAQPPVPVQRRHDVRGEVRLPLRAEPLSGVGGLGGLGAVGGLGTVGGLGGLGRPGGAEGPRTMPGGAWLGEGIEEAGGEGSDVGRSEPGPGILHGVTMDVSAGGICAQLITPTPLRRGCGLYVEVDRPDGVASMVVSVVEHHGRRVRARFATISPRDREAFAKLVFAQQRVALAQRRRRLDGTG